MANLAINVKIYREPDIYPKYCRNLLAKNKKMLEANHARSARQTLLEPFGKPVGD